MEKKDYINTWIAKADGDLKVAERELSAADSVLDAVCFHLQVKKFREFVLNKIT